MATTWKRVLTDQDLTQSFGNLGTGDLAQADSVRKYKMGSNPTLKFESNLITDDPNTSVPVIEINSAANVASLYLAGHKTYVGYNGSQYHYQLPDCTTFSNRTFVFGEDSKQVKFKSSSELFNPVDGLAYEGGYESVTPVRTGANADSALIYDKSGNRLSTATIEDVVGSKIFTLTFGLNAAIQPGNSPGTAASNEFMRGTNGVQFAQNYGHMVPVNCKIVGGTFSFKKDVDGTATSGLTGTRRRFNIWIGSVTSTPGSSGDAAFPNAALAFSSDYFGYNIAQDSYIGAYEFDYDTTLSAGDFVTVGITSYITSASANGPTSNHQVTLYLRYLD